MTAPFIEIFQYDLPFVRTLKLRGQTLTRRQGLVLKVGRGDQKVGYGEIAPLPGFSIETLDEAKEAAIKWADLFWRLSREADSSDGEPALAFLLNTPSVFFGTECATLGLARSTGAAAPDPGGGGSERYIPVNGFVLGPFDENIARARALHEEGYRALKLKLGNQPIERDIEMVREIRKAVGGEMAIRLDANGAWDFDTAKQFARSIADIDIEYIEEPLDDSDRLEELVERTGLPVALDETVVHGVFDDQFFADKEWATAIILKPTILGGITTCRDLAVEALEHGIQPVVSSCFESGLGLVALAHLAESLTGEAVPVGLDTYNWLATDILDRRFTVRKGTLDLDELDACAATINTAALEKIYSG